MVQKQLQYRAASSSPSKSVRPMLAESCSGAGFESDLLPFAACHLSPPFISIHFQIKGKVPPPQKKCTTKRAGRKMFSC